jgi:hypothetical protein
MKPTVIAIDIAKTVFQLHWVEPTTGEIHRLKLNPSSSPRWPKTFANKCGFSWRPLRLPPRLPTQGLSIHQGLLFGPGYQPGTTNR